MTKLHNFFIPKICIYTGSHSVLDNASALHAQGPGFDIPAVQYVFFNLISFNMRVFVFWLFFFHFDYFVLFFWKKMNLLAFNINSQDLHICKTMKIALKQVSVCNHMKTKPLCIREHPHVTSDDFGSFLTYQTWSDDLSHKPI